MLELLDSFGPEPVGYFRVQAKCLRRRQYLRSGLRPTSHQPAPSTETVASSGSRTPSAITNACDPRSRAKSASARCSTVSSQIRGRLQQILLRSDAIEHRHGRPMRPTRRSSQRPPVYRHHHHLIQLAQSSAWLYLLLSSGQQRVRSHRHHLTDPRSCSLTARHLDRRQSPPDASSVSQLVVAHRHHYSDSPARSSSSERRVLWGTRELTLAVRSCRALLHRSFSVAEGTGIDLRCSGNSAQSGG